MADYNDQVNRLWDEWTSETGQESGDPGEFVEWAVASRRLALRPQDVNSFSESRSHRPFGKRSVTM